MVRGDNFRAGGVIPVVPLLSSQRSRQASDWDMWGEGLDISTLCEEISSLGDKSPIAVITHWFLSVCSFA